MNPYGYQDTTNDKGQVTGGTTFNPNYQPVAQVDLNEIYQKALSTVGVDSSQGEQLVWGDENGNLRQGVPNIAGGDLPYLKTSQGIQRLDANKIRQAVEAAIDATPVHVLLLNKTIQLMLGKQVEEILIILLLSLMVLLCLCKSFKNLC